jgi:hypothetical protein
MYNLTKGLLTLYGLFLCSVFCVLYCSVTVCYSVLLFFSVYCNVNCSRIVLCLLVMYVLLPYLKVSCAFNSVVRQMPGYNSQRRGTARTSKIP